MLEKLSAGMDQVNCLVKKIADLIVEESPPPAVALSALSYLLGLYEGRLGIASNNKDDTKISKDRP